MVKNNVNIGQAKRSLNHKNLSIKYYQKILKEQEIMIKNAGCRKEPTKKVNKVTCRWR